MTLANILLLVLALYLVQLFLQETSRFGFDIRGMVGTRDALPETSVVAARLDRAKENMRESLPFFIGISLLAIATGAASEVTTAALVFLGARVLYVPAYVSGVPVLRSATWLVSIGALVAMALPLVELSS